MGTGLAILISGIVAAIASAGVGIFNTISSANENQANIKAQEDANSANIAMQRETNEQNEQLMRESWQRDDTALQRSLADAKAAGLSPLAGLGGASNSGPITLSSPQTTAVHSNMNRSGFNQIGEAVKSLGDIPYMATQGAMQDEQLEQMRLQNEAMRDSNIFSKFKMLKEFDNIDLQNSKLRREIEDYIGDMLARGVLSTDDTKGTKWAYVKPNNRYSKEDAFRTTDQSIAQTNAANSARANQIAADRLEADKAEREWQHNAEEKTHTVRNKVAFEVMGQKYELEITDTSRSTTTAVSAGVTAEDSVKPVSSIAQKRFVSDPVVHDQMDRNCYFVGVSAAKGLPCYSDGNWSPTYYVAIPTTTGVSYYKIKRGNIAMMNSGRKADFAKVANDYVGLWHSYD